MSSPGESHPQALSKPDVNLSIHTAPIVQPQNMALLDPKNSSHCWLIPRIKPDNATPSLHPNYRDFNTTTSCSAPVLRFGTLILVGLPLGFLPYQ
ncbi:hypothetical protein [uncultured Desulfobacter sp.]|uniref:hypothetical protein n=1 Tax=uncultured Desulfobacter sp. TaxID=240139 RepID=UPI002AA7C487|nr:hypothetical protein [uncultured Desulfobacter sp.]